MASEQVSRELVLDPPARLRMLSGHASAVHIDKSIPVKRYLRSGSEMERQVTVLDLQRPWVGWVGVAAGSCSSVLIATVMCLVMVGVIWRCISHRLECTMQRGNWTKLSCCTTSLQRECLLR